MGTSRGIDVSVYQGAQDWAAHKKSGVVFGFAKASEGQRTRDAHFDTHITGIKKAGLVPGAYHFAWPNQPAAAEAANYIAAVRPYAGPGFVHWLDLERKSDGSNYAGCTSTQIRAYAAAWIAAVEHVFPGQRVGIYTSASDLAAGHVPAGATIWYPAYPGTSVDTYAEAEKRSRPTPSGRTVSVWQFTSNPAGGGPNLDLNIAYMSPADLRTWAGAAKPTPAPAPKPTPKPVVDLSKLAKAAHTDPHAGQGHVTYKDGVQHVEAALLKLGYLAKAYSSDGSFGSATITAYAKWQRHLGYTGTDANGVPGKTSLTKLGSQTGLFTVTA